MARRPTGGVSAVKPKGGSPYGNSGGGVAYDPNAKVPKAAGKGTAGITLVEPPLFTFDPALSAQRRGAARGLSDKLEDVETERHFDTRNLADALRDITRNTKRSRFDTNRSYERGNEDLDERGERLQRDATRTREDFATKRAEIVRQFGDLAHRQGEAANAAGVMGSGTSAASAAARARNQQLAEAPLATGERRLDEDLFNALEALGVDRTRLGENRDTVLQRLHQDRDLGRDEKRQDYGRNEFLRDRTEGRAIREGTIADVDLLQQMIYQARQEHPGAFKQWARENQDVMALIRGEEKKERMPALGNALVAPPPRRNNQKKKGRR